MLTNFYLNTKRYEYEYMNKNTSQLLKSDFFTAKFHGSSNSMDKESNEIV